MSYQYQDVPKDLKPPSNMGSGSNSRQSGILVDIKEMEEHHNGSSGIKVEHGVFISDTNSFQPAVIKTEDDEYSEFEFKYDNKELYVTCKENTSGVRNMENNPLRDVVAGPSSPYEPKREEVDLGVVKMEEDKDTTSESSKVENRESGHLTRHTRTSGGKLKKSFDCSECRKEFTSKLSLDSHIVTRHYDVGEMMDSVTNTVHRCDRCSYITVRMHDFTQHTRMHGEKLEKTFNCTRCEKEFLSKQKLDGHVVSRHSNDAGMMDGVTYKILRCKICKYVTVYANNLAKHIRTHGGKLEKTFECTTCRKEFSRKDGLDNHIVTQHSDVGEMMNMVTCKTHRCKHCNYITIHSRDFAQHVWRHGEKSGKTFDCIRCEKEFSNKRDLDDHIVLRHSSDAEIMKSVTHTILRCFHCEYLTVIKKKLNNHMRTHGGKFLQTFDCVTCKKRFSTRLGLDNHIVKKHNNDDVMMSNVTSKVHRCRYCRYITVHATNLTQHMWKHGEKLDKTFDCFECRKEFGRKLDLDRHIVARHHDNAEMMESVTKTIHRCMYCGYITVVRKNLRKHVETHEGKVRETFDCITCKKTFLSKFGLDNHIVTKHNDDDEMMNNVTTKVRRCKHCEYITVHAANFAQHMRKHGEKSERILDCVRCKKEFCRKIDLDRHIVARHSSDAEIMRSVTNKTHRCNQCRYITVLKTNLNKHMRTHGEKNS